ncbi:MAG: DUF3307 domain-containing protein [Carboxydocellales bacterium]
MTLFDLLIVGHLIGDFILQNRWMAEGKVNAWTPLLVHSAVYTGVIALVALLAGGISLQGIMIIFLAHVLQDRRVIVRFWAEKVTQGSEVPWLMIMLDQSWHVVFLAIATLV